MQQVVKHIEPTSSGVVARIEQGDPEAESQLVKKYARGVRLLLIRRTGNSSIANDLTQDTFIVVLQKLRAGELRQHSSLAGFIRQVAVNLSIQHFRKEKRYVQTPDEIFELDGALRDKKDRKVDFEAARTLLENALEQLAVSRDREILRRFYLSDDDKEVICRDLGLSTTHFDRVLYRAKQRMRELINQQDGLKSLLFGGLSDA